ncbi:hypothetical protein HJG54_29205 [Leptolyngbya sp. NK1-12]|uniref:Uncharacterized protein n=2 Tax=Leptolyngbya sp. NK1-12 TaxID=2547451 RepID=A0AA96WME8_9CYAN|nr:hypothetical protein HJG54_29205 [Leptolyngbya sp. NK1-12]
MFNYLRQEQFQKGQRDRDAGLLPRMQDESYLSGYLKGRPEGLDSTIQYFASVDEYLIWKQRTRGPWS